MATEEVSKNLVAMKEILYGTNEKEPQTEAVAQLAQELYNSGLLSTLVADLQLIDFEIPRYGVCQELKVVLAVAPGELGQFPNEEGLLLLAFPRRGRINPLLCAHPLGDNGDVCRCSPGMCAPMEIWGSGRGEEEGALKGRAGRQGCFLIATVTAPDSPAQLLKGLLPSPCHK
ncbi:UNVERIFIED_CONTAM: hypothetical protein K2H54_054655 [Gekko kuhli]